MTLLKKLTSFQALIYFFLGLVICVISPSFAASTGGCDNYTPTTNGSTVTCTPTTSPAASSGVISPLNSTTTGNNITVNINSGTVLDINGSTVGLGSGATVNNYGTLNTNSFFNGYGISSGVNGRSQAGGATLNNYGIIITAGTGADGISIRSDNASSTASTVNNTGSITTSGNEANGIQIRNGGALATVINSGTINVSGTDSNGINIIGAASITNSGTISSNGNAISFTGTIPTGLRNTLNINSGSSITGAITFNASGSNETLTFNGYSGSLNNTITNLDIINATNSSSVVMNNAAGLILGNGQITVDASSSLQIDSVMSGTGPLVKEGGGVLNLTGTNTYSGATSINAGTLLLSGSIASNTTLASGANLQGGGSIFGNLTNSGNIQPSDNNQLKNLTVSGYYVGAGGTFTTNIYAPIENPVADNLIVGGAISGSTLIVGVDRGGLGRPTTGDGIQVVQGTGPANSFAISGRVASGAYEYRLYRGNSSGTNTNNWYLRTDNLTPPVVMVTPDIRQRVEVAVYPAITSLVQLYAQTVTDTLDQRRTDLSLKANQQSGQRDWIRMIGKTGTSTPSQVNDGPGLGFNAYALQFGTDLYQDHQVDGSSTYIGPYVTIGSANAQVSNFSGDVKTGNINGLTAYSFGVSATHFAANGMYVDALAQYSRYLRVQGVSDQNAQLETQGTGFTGSVETGARWYVKENYFFSPQVQLVYDSIGMNNASDQYGQMTFSKSEISRGRAGLMFGHRNLSSSLPIYAHLRASYWGTFNPGTTTSFESLYGANPIAFDSYTGSKWVSIDGQINASITKLTNLFVNLGWENSLVGTYKAWNGRIGVQTRF